MDGAIMVINTNGVDSCEVFPCKCSKCDENFTMGCSDVKYIKFCPFCGSEIMNFKINGHLTSL